MNKNNKQQVIALREMRQAQKELAKRIKTIPSSNKLKFLTDLDKLIDYAHGDDYENFDI